MSDAPRTMASFPRPVVRVPAFTGAGFRHVRTVASLLLASCLAACGGSNDVAAVAEADNEATTTGPLSSAVQELGNNQGSSDIQSGGINQGGGAETASPNSAPALTSSSIVTVSSRTTGTIYTAIATDAEGDKLTYSISGDDAARFTIDPSTGALAFKTPPNRAAPADSRNEYLVTLTVSDGKFVDGRTLSVRVLDSQVSKAYEQSNAK